MKVLSIDIGGTNFRVGIVSESGTVEKLDRIPTASVIRSGNVLEDLFEFLNVYPDGTSFNAVAIGFPATLNRERTQVVQAPNIAFMEDLPVCAFLEDRMHLPVLAERDVTFSLCYDVEKYQLSTDGLICGIYYGTGIGNAILLNGTPLSGRHGAAGELGHIPVFGSTERCGCGNFGCLEAVAGGKALARIQKERYPETPINEMFLRHGQEHALVELIDGMAMAAATEINILDPDQVLLGGGVLNMQGFPREILDQKIREHTRKPLPCRELNLIYTDDEPEKSVVGGAIYACRKLGVKP